jgi:hypothetical protein
MEAGIFCHLAGGQVIAGDIGLGLGDRDGLGVLRQTRTGQWAAPRTPCTAIPKRSGSSGQVVEECDEAANPAVDNVAG